MHQPIALKNSPQQPKEIAEHMLSQASLAYYQGAYDTAEHVLQESLLIYPFIANVHVMLGKIWLMRASAMHNPSMLHHAQLMFEMAHHLDPQSNDAALLLQLFQPTKP